MENRVKRVRSLFKVGKLDALLVSSNANIFYLTGYSGFLSEERDAYLLVTKNSAILFTNALYFDEVKKSVKAPIKVFLVTQLQKTLEKLLKQEKIVNIGFEENLTYQELIRFKKVKNTKWKLTEGIVEKVRAIKDRYELESLRKACKLTDNTLSNILTNVRLNMTEKELAWEVEKFIREHGGELAFPSIVSFGKNSAVPHHKTNGTRLELNSIVLLDFGAKVNGYCADMTRTVFFGKANKKFKKIYNTVLKSQEEAIKSLDMRKIKFSKLQTAANKVIMDNGFEKIPHGLGHGVGLEVHEFPHISPHSKDEARDNMVFTIEPGIYENNFGGVRIEDVFLYKNQKTEALTKSSKNFIEL